MSDDIVSLEHRETQIAVLEAEIARLQAENEALRKTVRDYAKQLALDTGDRRLRGIFGG